MATLEKTKVKNYLHLQEHAYTTVEVYYSLQVLGETVKTTQDWDEHTDFYWNKDETYHWEVFQPLVQSYFVGGGGFCEGDTFRWLERLHENFCKFCREVWQDWKRCNNDWNNNTDNVREDYKSVKELWFEDYPEEAYSSGSWQTGETCWALAELYDKWVQQLGDKVYLGGFWDYEIRNNTLIITLIAGDNSGVMDTRNVDKAPSYDWCSGVADDFYDLEQLDAGVVPDSFELYEARSEADKEFHRYVLSRHFWAEFEERVYEWFDALRKLGAPYENSETVLLVEFIRANLTELTSERLEEEVYYPGFDEGSELAYYLSLFN